LNRYESIYQRKSVRDYSSKGLPKDELPKIVAANHHPLDFDFKDLSIRREGMMYIISITEDILTPS